MPSTSRAWWEEFFDCRKPWEEARESVGLPEIQVKDLRRHFAIELAEKGATMHDIQQALGHALPQRKSITLNSRRNTQPSES